MSTGKNTTKHIDTVSMKWKHLNTKLETLWIRRHLGDDKFFAIADYLITEAKPSKYLPNDVYCDVDILAKFDDPKQLMWYNLTY